MLSFSLLLKVMLCMEENDNKAAESSEEAASWRCRPKPGGSVSTFCDITKGGISRTAHIFFYVEFRDRLETCTD